MVTAGNCYRQVFKGQPDQASQVRHAVGQQARNTPVADDVVLIASELASNAVLHSRSRGEIFAVACEVFPQCVRIEVADLGGEWCRPGRDGRPHGLEIVARLAARWGVEPAMGGCRVVWARVDFNDLMTRRQVAYRFGVTSAAVATWARRNPSLLTEVRNKGKPRYKRAEVDELFASGFRGATPP